MLLSQQLDLPMTEIAQLSN